MTVELSLPNALQHAPSIFRRRLRRLRLRVRLLLALRLTTASLATVAAICVPAILLLRLRGLWYPLLLPEAALAATIVVSLLAAFLWSLPDKLLAENADRRLQLHDRVASSLDFIQAAPPSGMQQAAILDALAHLDRLHPREAFPARAPRYSKTAVVCLVFLALAQLLPIPALLLSPREREEKVELREQAAKIEPLAKELERAATEAQDEEAAALAREMEKLVRQLQRGQLAKKQALLNMSELEQKLDHLDQRLAAARPKTAAETAQRMQQAAEQSIASKAMELARQAAAKGDQEAAKQLEKIAEQASKTQDFSELQELSRQLSEQASKLGASLGLPPDLLSSLAESLGGVNIQLSEEALKKLAEAAQNWSSDLTPEEQQALAEELKELAKLLEGSDLKELQKLLEEASECLSSGNCDKAGKLLAKASSLSKTDLAKARLAAVCQACKAGCKSGSCSGNQITYGQGKPAPQQSIPPNAPSTQLFAPRGSDLPAEAERVRAQVNPQGPMLSTSEQGAPTKITESRVPYYEVISEYSKSAEEALAREEVPAAYRGSVRSYFESLQAGAKSVKK